ncbi:MAG TPA: redoxin domain-containing protein, partial [Gemmataceae bacterium]|nr:redoxin domain-containing protein [Gemmataceae bacterium]
MQAVWLSVAVLTFHGDPAAIHPVPLGTVIADFTLRDHRGGERRLAEWRENGLVVIVFLGVDCPLVNRYAERLCELARRYGPRGVAFIGVNANAQDGVRDIARYVRTHGIPFPILKDVGNVLADRLGATRTPEVFVLDQARALCYRGRIDDQFGVGTQKPEPYRRDLAEALDELLAGKPVSQPTTDPAGCFIGRVSEPAGHGTVTWTRDVVPVLQKRCQACHRPGQAAPFPLLTYEDASGWADTIREVIEQGRMPPWHADPRHGRFANDPSLSRAEKAALLGWIDAGCPRGDLRDLPAPAQFPDDWRIGKPDRIIPIPEAFDVPAQGIIDYQLFEVDPGFATDTWVAAAEIRPGNPAVVHHSTVYLAPPTAPGTHGLTADFGLSCLVAAAPGTPPMVVPEGTGKRVPAGWHFLFVVHYVAIGSAQRDQTRVGLRLADPRTVRKEVTTHLLIDSEFRIPPRAKDFQIEKEWQAPADVQLLSMFPHGHWRARSFRYEAIYPDGDREILLDVPRYEFTWQNAYILAEPKRLPRGTIVRCLARYDNSSGNPVNPDPDQEVSAGPQSTDEMFNGYFDWVLVD